MLHKFTLELHYPLWKLRLSSNEVLTFGQDTTLQRKLAQWVKAISLNSIGLPHALDELKYTNLKHSPVVRHMGREFVGAITYDGNVTLTEHAVASTFGLPSTVHEKVKQIRTVIDQLSCSQFDGFDDSECEEAMLSMVQRSPLAQEYDEKLYHILLDSDPADKTKMGLLQGRLDNFLILVTEARNKQEQGK